MVKRSAFIFECWRVVGRCHILSLHKRGIGYFRTRRLGLIATSGKNTIFVRWRLGTFGPNRWKADARLEHERSLAFILCVPVSSRLIKFAHLADLNKIFRTIHLTNFNLSMHLKRCIHNCKLLIIIRLKNFLFLAILPRMADVNALDAFSNPEVGL